ncbi:hypothetical protein JCM19235_1365 [Vibrio maritimus]|uniref:Chromosome (Plasmid) partitioning protein ParA n=1 Tax=Vibrio maritimus TaxID=990268 RepID=A0A090S990_9VIBR|nr:hypothetical protein JCM19235_1365 [Vibrio maritimus]
MGKIVTVASQKGGTGKSTSVFHLGYALHKLGKKVAIIDTDARQATLMSYYSSRRINANREELTGKGFDLDFYPEVAVVKHDQPYRKTLSAIRNSFDIALLDTKGEFERFQLDLVRESDYVIVPIGASGTDLQHSDIVIEAITDENVNREDDEKLGYSYLIQKAKVATNSFKHFYRKVEDEHHVLSYIPHSEVIAAVTPFGFTSFDAIQNMSVMKKFIEEDWEDTSPSFNKADIQQTNDLIMKAAESLLEKIYD